MQDSNYTIRAMTRQDVDVAIDWAAAEGWNPETYDADCFYAADPDGFLIGLVGNEPVATLSAVKYDDSFGFLGFYIVKPNYRGQGYGLQIWNAGLAYLEGCTIGLDGVVAQQENYRQSGFTFAYNNVRYQGVGGRNCPTDAAIVPLSTIPLDDLGAYNKPFFPDDRLSFLQCWIARPQSTALGILRNNKLAGYGVARICRTGYKVGPLFADSEDLADQLFSALKAHVPADAPIFLDIPMPNTAAVELVQRHKMTAVFETARMYKGKSPAFPLERLFGVMTFELG